MTCDFYHSNMSTPKPKRLTRLNLIMLTTTTYHLLHLAQLFLPRLAVPKESPRPVHTLKTNTLFSRRLHHLLPTIQPRIRSSVDFQEFVDHQRRYRAFPESRVVGVDMVTMTDRRARRTIAMGWASHGPPKRGMDVVFVRTFKPI